jgi:hypothetical protein
MRILLAALAACLLSGAAHAERLYNQGELDAMLAPIALQPDGVVSQVLIAATYPDEVRAAAGWSRANPHMRGEDAVRAVQHEPWDPAVKALVAFPELLIRMDESPQWLSELGEAFRLQQAQVMDTVQALRRRAQANGSLATTDQYTVYEQDQAIVVQPRTQIVYVNYYDPYVVYGPWWWPYYRPVFWTPWVPRPVFVAHGFFHAKPVWHQRHVHVVPHSRWQPRKEFVSKPYVRVPESQRRPIVQQHMPAASGFSSQKREFVREQHRQSRATHGTPQVHKQWGNSAQRAHPIQQRGDSIQQRGHSIQQRGNSGRGGGQRGHRG